MSFPWEDDWGGVAVESDVPWEDTFKEEPPEPPLVLGQPEAPVAEVDSMRPVMAGEPVDLGPQRPFAIQFAEEQPLVINPNVGRVPTGEMSTTYGGPRKPLAGMAETLSSARQETEGFGPWVEPMRPRVEIPGVEVPPESSFAKAAALELVNVAKSVPEFFTSPVGITALFGSKIAPKLVSAGFSVDLLRSGLIQAKQANENWDQMTDAEKGVAVVDTTSALLFSGMAGAHAAGVKLKPAAKPEFQGPIATGEVLPMPRPAVPVRMPIQLPDAARVEPPPGVVVEKPKPASLASTKKKVSEDQWERVYRETNDDVLRLQGEYDDALKYEPDRAASIKAERDDAIQRLGEFDLLTRTAGSVPTWESSPQEAAVFALRDNPRLTLPEAMEAGKELRRKNIIDRQYDGEPIPGAAYKEFPGLRPKPEPAPVVSKAKPAEPTYPTNLEALEAQASQLRAAIEQDKSAPRLTQLQGQRIQKLANLEARIARLKGEEPSKVAAETPPAAPAPKPEPPAPPAPKPAEPAAPKIAEDKPTQAKEPWEMTKAEVEIAYPERSDIGVSVRTLPEAVGTLRKVSKATSFTPNEYNQAKESAARSQVERLHRAEVEKAIREGKPVPPEVLKDYPDLVKPAAPTPDLVKTGVEKEAKKPSPVWKVSYTDLETRAAKRPFFKHTAEVEATTRKAAIEMVQNYHGNSTRYGEFRASKAPEGTQPMSMFRQIPEEAPPPTPPAAAAKVEAQPPELTEAEKVQKYASGMVVSAGNYIRRSIDAGASAKDAALQWAKEIGQGLMDTPDDIYRKERGGLYTSTYVKGVFGSQEGVAINAKEYLSAIDAARTDAIKRFKRPVPEPPAAAAKVEAEVQKVAATEGQRPAKEIKEEYVQRVEDEINALIKENDEAGTTLEKSVATPESEGGARWSYGGTYADITKTKSGYHVATNVESPLHSTTGSRVKLSGTFKTLDEVEWFIKAVGSSGKGSITVDIPGDGITTIVRKGPSLIDVWKGARKLETKSEAKAKPVPSGGESGKVDADEIAATATKLYGDARKAIAGIKRQLASEQELEPGQRDLLERAIQALTDELPEVKRQNRIDELTDIIQLQEQDLETAQKRIDQVRSEMKSKSGTAKQRQFIYEQETLIRNTNLQLPKRKEELNQLRAQQIAEQPAPIPQGPGGMTRRESARPEPLETIEGTGLKHAIDELERVGYNLAGRTKQEVQNMWDSYQRAKDTLAKNPDAGRELIDAMASDPRRRISREEHPVLLRYKVALENAINDAAERTVSGPMEGRAEARAQFDKRRAELQKFLDVLAFSGSEAGREMRWRQALAFEDFSFASQERRLAAAKGRPLTDPEIVALKQQIADLEAKRAAAEKSYQEREQRAAEAAVKKALDELSKNAPPPRYAPRVLEIAENFANYVEKKAAKAREELDALWAKPGVLSGPLNPEVLDRLAIIGVAKITRGAVEFAKWSDAMIRDLGDRVKPYLDEAFKKAQTLFDSELGNVGKKVGHTVATVVRKKLAEQPAADQISAITASIGKKIGKSSNADICVLVRKLARIHVDEALKVGKKLNHKELIDLLHSDILPFASDITRREVMDAFSGYGDYRLLPKDAVSVILRDLKGQSQQIAKLEDMASGRAPQKTGIEHRTPSDIERGQIKQVEEAKRRGGYAITDQDTQLRTAMDAVKTRLQNQITDLETQIQTRQKIVKDRTRLQYDDEANSLKARRDELKAQFDEIFPKEPITEAERLQLWKDRTTRRIAEIQDMLRSGDIEKKPTRPPLELDAEANRLKAQFDEAKDRLQHERDKAEWERLSVFQKAGRGAVDAYDAARLILTTGEFSFILRQAFPIVAAHPIQSARALPAMFKAMRNWRTAREVDLRITEHPDFAAAKKAGLHIVDETASISRQEEITAGRWAHALPVVAHFNRAARTFLNKIRFDTWLAMRKTMHRFGEPTPEGDALIAKHINEATGRGSLGFAEPDAVALSRLFFAPRYAVSRFQYLTGHSLWAAQGKGTAAARTTIAIEYARELIGMGLFFATLKALFSNSTTQLDPRSTDFLKLVMGNTRLDALAGLSQAAVFSARTALTGVNAARDALGLPLFRPESLTGKGKEVRLHKPRGQKQLFGQEGYVGTVKNFLRSKAHPVPSIYLNLMSGTGFAGKEATVESELGGLAAPITYQDIYTALRTEGLDHKTALSLLALLGSGIQNYSTKK